MTGDEQDGQAIGEAQLGSAPGSLALSFAPVASAEQQAVPAGVARVQGFVNTCEIDGDEVVEGLGTPTDLAAWLEAHGLLEAGNALDEDDLRQAIEVREALRELLEGNAGHEVDPTAISALREAAAAAPVAIRFDPGGGASFAPAAHGLRAALGRIFADIATATADGTWARLKVCRNDECRWAYYDGSRNRSGRWCSMASCGNRMKGRAYRSRARAPSAEGGSTA